MKMKKTDLLVSQSIDTNLLIILKLKDFQLLLEVSVMET